MPRSAISAEAARAALAAAEQYLNNQELDKAETILIELVAKAPDEAEAHSLYGQILYLRGFEVKRGGDEAAAEPFFAQAYRQYHRATELQPDSAGLHDSAGLMAQAAGLDEDALRHYQTAARLDPTDPRFPLHEAQQLIAAKRLDEAEAALGRVLEIDPDEPFAHASLAIIALERGEFETSLNRIEIARDVDPESLALRVQHARILRRSGQPRRSLELLVPLDQHARAEESVAGELAAAYFALHEPEKAAAAWEHRFRLNQADWGAAVHAAEARLRAGQPEHARLLLDLARLLAPGAAEVVELEGKLGGGWGGGAGES